MDDCLHRFTSKIAISIPNDNTKNAFRKVLFTGKLRGSTTLTHAALTLRIEYSKMWRERKSGEARFMPVLLLIWDFFCRMRRYARGVAMGK